VVLNKGGFCGCNKREIEGENLHYHSEQPRQKNTMNTDGMGSTTLNNCKEHHNIMRDTSRKKIKGGFIMKRDVLVKLLIVVFVVSTFFMFCCPLNAQEKVFKLRYSNFFPPAHPNAAIADQWCKEIEKRTNGRVKITHFPGNILAPAQQAYDAAVKGIVDISECWFAATTGRQPMMELIDQPLGYMSGVQATGLINAYYKKFKPKELDDVKVLLLHAHGPGLIQTKKPISKIEDIKGLRIKCMGTTVKVVQAYGGVPVTIPLTETYDALQKGLADGVLLITEALKGWKLGELIKCTLKNNGIAYSTGQFVVMNKTSWNSLPPDIQKIIEQVSEERIERQGKLWDQLDKEALDFYLKQKGHIVVEVSKEEQDKTREKMKPILNEYVKSANAKGLPGEEALKFCLDWLKAHP
jgi:TRAP-type transport system periplasmic protein